MIPIFEVKKQGWLHLLQEKCSADIYRFLETKNLLRESPEHWWPNAGTFEVVIGAVLTQNTSWNNVEKSLKNLDAFLTLEDFMTLDEKDLKELIRPSGFYNQKAPRLLTIAKNIKQQYGDFQTFQNEVSREWLLVQKGIGEESADAILCYGCFRDEMVVDSYTKRLLQEFHIEFSSYGEYKTFLQEGIASMKDGEKNSLFIKFHGMIVEYNKLKTFK